jgi:hypothetical protein
VTGFDPLPPLDDLLGVTTPWGRMQLWKARAMCLAYTQTVIADADTTPLRDEDKPPELAADPVEPSPVTAEQIATLEAKVDELTARFNRWEAEKRAERALLDLVDRRI